MLKTAIKMDLAFIVRENGSKNSLASHFRLDEINLDSARSTAVSRILQESLSTANPYRMRALEKTNIQSNVELARDATEKRVD